MRTPMDDEVMDPRREIWLKQKLPVYLVRFFREMRVGSYECPISEEDLPVIDTRPVLEHVYRPSGMESYTPKQGRLFHYEYEQTRKVEMPALRGECDQVPKAPER